jgi:hypothetical protein
MIVLRWLLGISASMAAAGWLLIAFIGNDVRRSFGASGVDSLTFFAPPVVLLLALLTVLQPAHRGMMHGAALVFALAAVGLVLVLRESLFIGVVGLLFVAT